MYLEQLNAVRYDLSGEGISYEVEYDGAHRSAFPMAELGMGCPSEICGGYELISDLDFSERGSYASGTVNSKWTGGVGWLPIGIGGERFQAKFNGNGYAISNLFISRAGLSDTGATGLFGETGESSEISNLRLFETEVSGGNLVGGLVGVSEGTIRAVHVSGNVTGISEVGGLAGASSGEIVSSSVDATVLGENETGGLAGDNYGPVVDSFAMGTVSGQVTIGGLVGYNDDDHGEIVGSHFTGIVTGVQDLGGIAGANYGAILTSYSAGRVSGSTRDSRGFVGGLAGVNRGSVIGSYSVAQVSGTINVGGLVGLNGGSITTSYSKGSVDGVQNVGGLTGWNSGAIRAAYATGDVSGEVTVGGLVGYNDDDHGEIVGSHFTGIVTGVEDLGGIAGVNHGAIMTSYSAGRVSGSTRDSPGYVGGLAGVNYGSVINSYSVAQVSGTINVGGLVGLNGGSITTSYSKGSVDGVQNVGGLTGWNSGAIRAAYATGDVSGESYVGGLSGTNADGAATINSYAVGGVMRSGGDSNRLGGLFGSNYRATIIDSVWDTQSTRQRRGVGEDSASGVRGGITAQLQTPVGYTGIYSGWNVDVDNADGDFDPTTGRDDLWDFGNSRQYPALRVDFDGDGVASWQEFGDQRGNRGGGCPGNASCP